MQAMKTATAILQKNPPAEILSLNNLTGASVNQIKSLVEKYIPQQLELHGKFSAAYQELSTDIDHPISQPYHELESTEYKTQTMFEEFEELRSSHNPNGMTISININHAIGSKKRAENERLMISQCRTVKDVLNRIRRSKGLYEAALDELAIKTSSYPLVRHA